MVLRLAGAGGDHHEARNCIGHRPALLEVHQVTGAAEPAREIVAAGRVAWGLGPGRCCAERQAPSTPIRTRMRSSRFPWAAPCPATRRDTTCPIERCISPEIAAIGNCAAVCPSARRTRYQMRSASS